MGGAPYIGQTGGWANIQSITVTANFPRDLHYFLTHKTGIYLEGGEPGDSPPPRTGCVLNYHNNTYDSIIFVRKCGLRSHQKQSQMS